MPDTNSKFDRTATEDQLMKAIRRAGLALRKASRKSSTLGDAYRPMALQFEEESKATMARLAKLEETLGRKLSPVGVGPATEDE